MQKKKINNFIGDDVEIVEAMKPLNSVNSSSLIYSEGQISFLKSSILTLLKDTSKKDFSLNLEASDSDNDIAYLNSLIDDIIDNVPEDVLVSTYLGKEKNDNALKETIRSLVDIVSCSSDFIMLFNPSKKPFYNLYSLPPRIKYTNNVCSITDQDCVEDTDINNIIAHYKLTGEFPDVSNVADVFNCYGSPIQFNEAYEMIETASEAFMHLPAEVRYACDNDPSKFISMLKNPEHSEFLTKYGVLKPAENKGVKETHIAEELCKANNNITSVNDIPLNSNLEPSSSSSLSN